MSIKRKTQKAFALSFEQYFRCQQTTNLFSLRCRGNVNTGNVLNRKEYPNVASRRRRGSVLGYVAGVARVALILGVGHCAFMHAQLVTCSLSAVCRCLLCRG